MKTVTTLKNAQIFVKDELKETVEVKNPCQMWKGLRSWADKYGQDVRILVTDVKDKPYKDFTVKPLKNGKYILIKAITETNRGQVAKIKAKKAKRRAYDKARRERIKAQKAALKEQAD